MKLTKDEEALLDIFTLVIPVYNLLRRSSNYKYARWVGGILTVFCVNSFFFSEMWRYEYAAISALTMFTYSYNREEGIWGRRLFLVSLLSISLLIPPYIFYFVGDTFSLLYLLSYYFLLFALVGVSFYEVGLWSKREK